MKLSIPILLGAVLIGTVAFAGDEKEYRMKSKPAESEAMDVAGAPAGLHLKIVKDGFQLNWTLSPQDPGAVTGYEIVRADRFSGPYDLVATVEKGASEYIDTTASREIIYFYKVRAIAENDHSQFSNTVSGER